MTETSLMLDAETILGQDGAWAAGKGGGRKAKTGILDHDIAHLCNSTRITTPSSYTITP